jgi:tetratricopeptide (TPR) repeat protein
MTDQARVQALLEQCVDSGLPPERICADRPELLPQVRERWAALQRLDRELEALFPPGAPPAPAPATAPLPQVPGYLLLGELGRGGMGIVYRARHRELDREVALKMLLLGPYARAETVARFQREARLIAALEHPHVVRIFDVGAVDGRPYFTMELLGGGHLGTHAGGARWPVRKVAEVLATLADAVAAVHRLGIVHRDLKPANVLLTADGSPKIGDFGLARRLDGAEGVTHSGERLGTPSYMAPEQAFGPAAEVGPAADVYSLGAILYELLCGRPPFEGDAALGTSRWVLALEPQAPRRVGGRIPADLSTICLQCLRADPRRRYPTAAALAADLRRFLDHEPIRARSLSWPARTWRWTRRHPVRASLLGSAAAMGALSLSFALVLGLRAAELERAVRDELSAWASLGSAGDWDGARTRLERARARLGDGGGADLRAQVQQAGEQLQLVTDLDAVRAERVALTQGSYDDRHNRRVGDRAYERLFAAAGLAMVGEPAEQAAARVRAAAVRPALVAALDDWALCCSESDGEGRAAWVLSVARLADLGADGRTTPYRDPAAWHDLEQLESVTRAAVEGDAGAQILVTLAERVGKLGGTPRPLLQRALARHPDDFWLLMALGDETTHVDPVEAVRYYQAALALRPNSAVAHNNLGGALAKVGRLEEALEQFRSAVAEDPGFAHGLTNLGNSLGLLGDHEESVRVCRLAVDVDPLALTPHYNLGAALARAGRWGEAVDSFAAAREIGPTDAATRSGLCWALLELGRLEESLSEGREAVRLDPQLASGHSNLAQTLFRAGDTQGAADHHRRAVELRPDEAGVWINQAQFLQWTGRYAEAVTSAERAVQAAPELARARGTLGTALARVGRLPEALTELEWAAGAEPEDGKTHNNLALVLHADGQLERAIAHYRRAAELDPQLVHARLNSAVALLAADRGPEAEAAATEFLTVAAPQDPQRARATAFLEHCRRVRAAEGPLDALARGERAPTDLSPAEASELARAARELGRHRAAASLFERALDRGPAAGEEAGSNDRWLAACSAALTAAGRGSEGADSTPEERARWRARAWQWLEEDLAALRVRCAAAAGEERERLVGELDPWLADGALRELRAGTETEPWSAAERERNQALWAAVRDLRGEG